MVIEDMNRILGHLMRSLISSIEQVIPSYTGWVDEPQHNIAYLKNTTYRKINPFSYDLFSVNETWQENTEYLELIK